MHNALSLRRLVSLKCEPVRVLIRRGIRCHLAGNEHRQPDEQDRREDQWNYELVQLTSESRGSMDASLMRNRKIAADMVSMAPLACASTPSFLADSRIIVSNICIRTAK